MIDAILLVLISALGGCGSSTDGDGGIVDAARDARVDGSSDGQVDGAIDAGSGDADARVADAQPDAPIDATVADATVDPCVGVAIRSGADDLERTMPGYAMRPYDVHLPPGYDCAAPIPVLLVLHGGGSNKDAMHRISCPGGVLSDPGCMDNFADREGFAVVYPNGTPGAFPNVRTFNAGGGSGAWECVSGVACEMGIDDVAYVEALLDDLAATIAYDDRAVYATGISNGAAMSHRLACELSDRITAIAPVAGGNQFAIDGACAPGRPVPVLAIHGDEDPAWPYLGGTGTTGNDYRSIPVTMMEWGARNGCAATSVTTLPDVAADGTTVRRHRHTGCDAGGEVELYEVVGGGHTWPSGFQYFPVMRVGRTSQDIVATELMWSFFSAHRR